MLCVCIFLSVSKQEIQFKVRGYSRNSVKCINYGRYTAYISWICVSAIVSDARKAHFTISKTIDAIACATKYMDIHLTKLLTVH